MSLHNRVYVVVGSKSWSRQVFDDIISGYPGQWIFIDCAEQLTIGKLQEFNPRYLFFLHWSWKVPDELIDNYECICFHMTDVPFGRGGSPLQNLIIQGHQSTKLTALRMTQSFDAGPVYVKEDLCLAGNAEEIYIRANHLSAKMIRWIIVEQPEPIPQSGEVTIFKRRKPDESEIPKIESLQSLYDCIRMLDAEDYPKAFIQYQGFRYEFSRAALYNGHIVADVSITPIEDFTK